MATIKKGKGGLPEERLLTQTIIDEKGQLTVKLWHTKLERMETLTFSKEETDRIDGRLQAAERERQDKRIAQAQAEADKEA